MSSFDDNDKIRGNSSISIRLNIAKRCSGAILDEVENELDAEKTEVLDFACGTGLISQALCPFVKSIIGVDSAQAMVDEYNKKVWQQGIDENEMKAICLELEESEGDQLNGRKFDIVVCASAYHHIGDIVAITRILAFYLKPSGKLIVLDLVKDPAIFDKFYKERVENTVAHKGGFDPKEIEKTFLDTGVLKDVKVEVAFNFNKFIEKDQKEYTFKYLIAKGERKE